MRCFDPFFSNKIASDGQSIFPLPWCSCSAEEKYTIAVQRPITSLLSIAHRVNAQRLNTKPGAEFHAALEEAHQCGSDILFADRPSYITGRRIWRTISLPEVGRVIRAFASSVYAQSQEQKRRGQNVLVAIDQVMQDDGISHARDSLIPRLREASPTIARTWLDERDEFMVSGIKHVVDSEGTRMKNLVAIVGEAHVAGIAARLARLPSLRDPDTVQDELLSIPEKTFTSSVVLPSLLIGAPLALVSLPILGTWRFAHWAGPKLSKLIRG